MQLNPREKNILAAVIRTYIITGEPVGSKSLRDLEELNLSSATIRAQMNELCELGLLEQPHTSAGRVPTTDGYHYYIEQLMHRYHLSDEDKRSINAMLPDASSSAEEIIDYACEALAQLTNCAAMLTTPSDREAQIKKIQLISIGRKTVMVILITSTGIIKNRIAKYDFDINISILEKIDNVFKKSVYSITLEEMTIVKAQEILSQLGEDALSAAPIISALLDAVNDAIESEVKLKGMYNLLMHREFSSQKASLLLNYLQKRSSLLTILNKPNNEITVVLGNETGESALSSSGVIVTHYRVGTRDVGSVGILGPDRMDYEHIIPSMLYFRDSLSKLLTENFMNDI